jgi:hypothetical protein
MCQPRLVMAFALVLCGLMVSESNADLFGRLRRCRGAQAPAARSCCVTSQPACVSQPQVVVSQPQVVQAAAVVDVVPITGHFVETAVPETVCASGRCFQPVRKTVEVVGNVVQATGHVVKATAKATKEAVGDVLGNFRRCDSGTCDQQQ